MEASGLDTVGKRENEPGGQTEARRQSGLCRALQAPVQILAI